MIEPQAGLGQRLQEIQFALAPAVMISCSSLLLLGFQNKFTSMASRFRALNEEKRRLLCKPAKEETELRRLESLTKQVGQLLARTQHVKNAILMQYSAIIFFILSSLLLFMNVYTPFRPGTFLILSFISGLCLIFYSCVIMMREVALAYRIVDLEGKS